MTRRDFIGAAPAMVSAARLGHVRQPTPAAPKSPRTAPWRTDFPVLRQTVNGRPLAYLDSAATTQRPDAVVDAIASFYRHHNANPSGSLHTLARRAQEQYDIARATVARFLNARDPAEIVWTRGTTEGINLVAAAWGAHNLKPGDEILLTVAEHYSNLLPWRLVAERTGAKLCYADVDDAGRVLVEEIVARLSSRTRLVAFSHVSNVVGAINPAAEICARARAAGARVLIDAAQSAPHIPVDVQALGCDFLALSSHKMLGPMGVGVLWARRELLDAMPPYQAGSNMAHEVDFEAVEYEHGALKFGAGTPNVSGAVGLAAALTYLNQIGPDAIREHELAISERMIRRLRDVPGLRLLGPTTPSEKVSVFSFVIDGHASVDIVRHVDQEGIAIRGGDLAALPLLKRFGVSTAARASCYVYTTLDEVDRLADALQARVIRSASRSPAACCVTSNHFVGR